MLMTKRHSCLILTLALMVAGFGCGERLENETVAEGVIFSVSYKIPDGQTGGFTRVNNSKAVPGGNGTCNVDAYGRLTRDFLIITYPQKKYLGPHVIPVHRLLDVQFGDGGIKTVNENQPAP